MKNTNSKEYKEKFNEYILDCIEIPNANRVTSKDKIDFLFSEFERVANYHNNLKKFPNEQDRMADYLQGLPFSFEFENYKILQLAEKLHECKLTDKQEDVILKNYWKHLAFKILQLKRKLNKEKLLGKFKNEHGEKFEVWIKENKFLIKGDETEWMFMPIMSLEFMLTRSELQKTLQIINDHIKKQF